MAALLAARLQPPQEVLHKYVQAVKEVVGSKGEGVGRSGVRLRAALWGFRSRGVTSEARGRHGRRSVLITSFPRREALVFAMSESESDITDMKELADGSLFFSFGGSLPPRNAKNSTHQSRAKNASKTDHALHSLPPTNLPHRLPSSFRRASPIPVAAMRKKGNGSKKDGPATQPAVEERKTRTVKDKKKLATPTRPPSIFSKRSPIPKDRKGSLHEPDVDGHSRVSNEAATEPVPAATVYDPVKDSPLSPALQEVLNYGKNTATDEVKSTKSKATQSKKKSTKPTTENLESVQALPENGSVNMDLGSYKLPELRNLAKAKGLKGYSKLKKGDLIDLLSSSKL